MGIALAVSSALWGFAEATFFFVVPDVLLTWAAVRRGIRPAALAAAVAALGATLGGAAMMAWGALDPEGSRAAVELVPAIDGDMIEDVAAGMSTAWPAALLEAAFTGIPYKIFAQQAGTLGIDAVPFLLPSLSGAVCPFRRGGGAGRGHRRRSSP